MAPPRQFDPKAIREWRLANGATRKATALHFNASVYTIDQACRGLKTNKLPTPRPSYSDGRVITLADLCAQLRSSG